jgi:hypothetical protein
MDIGALVTSLCSSVNDFSIKALEREQDDIWYSFKGTGSVRTQI